MTSHTPVPPTGHNDAPGKSIQQALNALPAHYHDCAHITVSAECDCTATRDMGLAIERLFEARDEVDRLDIENIQLRAALSVCTTDTDLRDKLAKILSDEIRRRSDGEWDGTPSEWHVTADAMLPAIVNDRQRAVDQTYEDAANEIEIRAAEMATKSRDFGRGYMAAAYVVRSLKSDTS